MLQLVTASAGAGKTYRLSQEYIKLALQGASPNAFKGILAVTFTRKATAEIKARILEHLREMELGKMPLPLQGPAYTPALAGKVRRAILEQYDDFAVLTLDTFFQRIIRAFALELGLPANYQVEVRTEDIQQAIVERLLGRDTAADVQTLRPLLKQLVLEQLEDQGRWSIQGRIQGFAAHLFTTRFAALLPALQAQFGGTDLLHLPQVIRQERTALQEQLVDLQQQIDLIFLDLQKNFPDVFEALNYSKGYAKKLKSEGWAILADESGYVLKLHQAPYELDSYFNTKRLKTVEPAQAERVASQLGDIITKLCDLVRKNRAYFLTLDLLDQHLKLTLINTLLAHELQVIKDERNLFLLFQQADFLSRLAQENPASFIYEKLGTRIRHFLIDEMQDTSHQQWEALQPMLADALAAGHQSLIVGDVKQAIYRWREGDADLMLSGIQASLPKGSVQQEVLGHNYRSLGQIIDFNNRLVDTFPPRLRDALTDLALQQTDLPTDTQEAIAQAANQLVAAYDNGRQTLPEDKAEARRGLGYVQLEFAAKPPKTTASEPAADPDDEEAPDMPQLQARLQAWIDQAAALGYRPGQIGILVRGKVQATAVAGALLALQGGPHAERYLFSSEQSLAVAQASVVRFLASLGRVVCAPSDVLSMVAAVHEYHLYLKPLLAGNTAADPDAAAAAVAGLLTTPWYGDKDKVGLHQMLNQLPAGLAAAWPGLARLPAEVCLANLAAICRLNDVTSEQGYLLAFLEAVQGYAAKHGPSLAGFLDWWDDNGPKRFLNLPPSDDAMQLLTIHKSKGLEFDVVLIPFANEEIEPRSFNKTLLWLDTPSPERYHGLKLAAFEYGTKLKHSELARQAYQETVARALDVLNLAYVACTRAARMLFIRAKKPSDTFLTGKKTGLPHLNELFYELANAPAAGATPLDLPEADTFVAYAWGSPIGPDGEVRAQVPRQAIQVHLPKPKPPAPAPTIPELDLATGLLPDHELQARILRRWSLEGEPTAQVRYQLLADGLITHTQWARALQAVRTLVATPAMAALFGPAPQASLLLEPNLALPDGTLLQPQRLLLHPDHTDVVAIAANPAEAQAARPALARAAQALVKLGKPQVRAWLTLLDPLTVEEVAPEPALAT